MVKIAEWSKESRTLCIVLVLVAFPKKCIQVTSWIDFYVCWLLIVSKSSGFIKSLPSWATEAIYYEYITIKLEHVSILMELFAWKYVMAWKYVSCSRTLFMGNHQIASLALWVAGCLRPLLTKTRLSNSLCVPRMQWLFLTNLQPRQALALSGPR